MQGFDSSSTGDPCRTNALEEDEAAFNAIGPVGRETLATLENVLETVDSDVNDAEGSLVDRQAHKLKTKPFGLWPMLGMAAISH